MQYCKTFTLVLAVVVIATPSAKAAIVQWHTADGGNGHYYEVIDGIFTWSEAKADAETKSYLGVQGHLVTITTGEETDFLRIHLSLPQNKIEYWLGGFQDTGAIDFSEPAGGWRWITGEPWIYTNWWADEPSNNDGNNRSESFLQTAGSSGTLLRWNDGTENGSVGYIVEFDIVSEPAPIPEPASLAIWCGIGLLGLNAGWRRRKQSIYKP